MTTLSLIVQDALDQLEWQDEITVDEAAGTSQLKTLVNLEDQSCTIYIDTHEASDSISVFLYLPFCVKAAHYPEACMLVNAINTDARHGHLEIVADSGRIRLVVSSDVEGANPTGLFVVRMLQCGQALLSHWIGALAAVAISGRPAAAVLAEMTTPTAVDEPGAEGGEGATPVPVAIPAAARTLH